MQEYGKSKPKIIERFKLAYVRRSTRVHTRTYIRTCKALRPSALGELVVMALKMLTKTRKRVTKSAMRPWREERRELILIFLATISFARAADFIKLENAPFHPIGIKDGVSSGGKKRPVTKNLSLS